MGDSPVQAERRPAESASCHSERSEKPMQSVWRAPSARRFGGARTRA